MQIQTNLLKFKLPFPYQKILDHCIAYDDTLVFTGIKNHRNYCLTHVSQNGQVLGETIFRDDGVYSMQMVNKYEVIGLLSQSSEIVHWDLKLHQLSKIPFKFEITENFCSRIFVFQETNSIGIMEHGPLGETFFRITYLALPIRPNQQPNIIKVFDDQDHTWTNDHTLITKGNDSSMICWLTTRFSEFFEFFTYQIGEGLKSYKIKNEVGLPYGEPLVEIITAAMWETRPKEFMFICHSSRTKGSDGIINDNYIVNIRDETIRESRVRFETAEHHQLHIHQYKFGDHSVVRTISFENGKAIPTPVYYINNQTEEISAVELWECGHLSKFHLPGYDKNLMLEGLYENANVSQIAVMGKRVVYDKSALVFLLNEIVEDIDEDLLYDATQLIDYDQ